MIEAVKLEADIYPAGPRGLSAYEIYKKEGGQLSEEEWLKSLNGLTPTIGENGNWFLGTVDTGLPSRGPKGDTGSIKFIVVTELPTENIDETAIYMKPAKNSTGENNFEELIYVNGKWEDLGTPSVGVDLSNYYTKDESDKKLNEKQNTLTPGDNITIENNVISASGGLPELLNQEIDLTSIETGAYIISGTNTVIKTGGFVHRGIFANNQSRAILITCKVNNSGFGTGILIEGDFKSGVYGAKRSRIILYNYDGYDVLDATNILFKNNTITYTPTADYHPATKKYVDDNVKTYTAGDNITISEDNVISATISSGNYTIFENYNEWDTTENRIAFFTEVVNVLKEGKRAIILPKYQNRQGNETFVNNMYTSPDVSSIDLSAYTGTIRFRSQRFSTIGVAGIYSEVYRQDSAYIIAITLTNGVVTNVPTPVPYSYVAGTLSILSKTNGVSYTPTGDYNPSTKLYTDKTHYENMAGYDATKTQVLKNINGTLTWVDEA